MSVAVVVIAVGVLIFVSHVLSVIFEKLGVPDVLSLLLIGLLIGPVLHLVEPSDFGKLGGVFTTIALVGILFDSGVGLNFSELSESMMPAMKLTVINFVATRRPAGRTAGRRGGRGAARAAGRARNRNQGNKRPPPRPSWRRRRGAQLGRRLADLRGRGSAPRRDHSGRDLGRGGRLRSMKGSLGLARRGRQAGLEAAFC